MEYQIDPPDNSKYQLLIEEVYDLSDMDLAKWAEWYHWLEYDDDGKHYPPDMEDIRIQLIDKWAWERGI